MRREIRGLSIAAAIFAGAMQFGAPEARAAAVEAGVEPWPTATIPVWIHPDVRAAGRDRLLRRAMAEWNRKSGVRFVETPKPGRDTLRVYNLAKGARCDALTGYHRAFRHDGNTFSGGLVRLGACSYGSVLHELGHVLGLMHEHQRIDRDRYLDFRPVAGVLGACAKGGPGCAEALANVGSPRPLKLGSSYDPCSLMHYLADQSSKVRQGRFPPSRGWSRTYLLTAPGEANFRACKARQQPVDGCGWWKTGQKCQVTCQDANTVAAFYRLKPRMPCWSRSPGTRSRSS